MSSAVLCCPLLSSSVIYCAGCDAVTGLGRDQRAPNVNTDYQHNTIVNPYYLVDVQTGDRLWTNPTPGGATYARPLGHTTRKDNDNMMIQWIRDHEMEIRGLGEHTMEVEGMEVVVQYEVFPCLFDGKCRHGVYTAALIEGVRLGLSFKIHGDSRKMDYQTCWVRLLKANLSSASSSFASSSLASSSTSFCSVYLKTRS